MIDRPIPASYWVVDGLLLAGEYAGDLRTLLSHLRTNVSLGTPSYVHCWGGIGRTGTVIGCWLVEHNATDGKTALKRIPQLRRGTPDRARRSPETDEQWALVLGWAQIRQGMDAVEPEG